MRILLVTYQAPGQAANAGRALQLGRAMAAAGHHVTLSAGSANASLRAVRVVRSGVELLVAADPAPARLRRTGFSPFGALSRLRLLSDRRFDVVHVFGHRPAAWLPVAALRRRWGAAIVGDWADLFGPGGIADERGPLGRWTVGRLDGSLENWVCRQADALTVVTGYLEDEALRRGLTAGRVLRLPAGADVVAIQPLDKAEARDRMGIPQADRIVVHSGLSVFDRAEVAAVLARLAAQDPGVRLLLIGVPPGQARRWLRDPWLRQKLIVPGNLSPPDLCRVLACGDVMLLPLSGGGFNRARFPMRLGDFLAAGRPVVVSGDNDPGKLVTEAQAGVVCGDDPAEAADACLRLFRDPRRAQAMSRNARRLAEEQLAWPRLATGVLEFYRRLLAG